MSERGTVKNNRTAAVEGHYSPSISHPQVTPYTVTVGLFSSVRQLRVQIKQWASKCIQHSTVEIRDSDVIRQNGELDGVVVWGSGNVTDTVAQNVSKTIFAILVLSDHKVGYGLLAQG